MEISQSQAKGHEEWRSRILSGIATEIVHENSNYCCLYFLWPQTRKKQNKRYKCKFLKYSIWANHLKEWVTWKRRFFCLYLHSSLFHEFHQQPHEWLQKEEDLPKAFATRCRWYRKAVWCFCSAFHLDVLGNPPGESRWYSTILHQIPGKQTETRVAQEVS